MFRERHCTPTGGASTTADAYRTGERLEAARRRLSARSSALRADIQRELRKYDHDRYGVVADRVGDAGDDSVADLLVHVDLSEIQRDVAELRAIDAAFKRIAAGTYGYCTDCGEPIPTARLEQLWDRFCRTKGVALVCAYPSASFRPDGTASMREICEAHSQIVEPA